MKRICSGYLCILSILFGSFSSASGNDPGSIDTNLDTKTRRLSLFETVQTMTFNGELDSGKVFVDRYIEDFPDAAAGWLARSGLMLAQMSEDEQDTAKDEFKAAIDSALAKAQIFEDSCFTESAMLYLIRGHALTYLAVYESKFGFGPKAVKQGYLAKGEYEAGLECDSTLYDLYFGLGGFHYWKSVKAGILRKVRVFSDDVELGLRELKLTIDSSDFSAEAARNAMISIYLDQEKYDSALAICSVMIEKYPHGTLFLWPSGTAHFESGNFEKSAEIFEQLRTHYLGSPGNYFNMIECDQMITESLNKLGRKEEAATAAARFIDYESEVPKQTRNRQSDKIRFLKWWAKKLEFY